jgi:hypothetical protein
VQQAASGIDRRHLRGRCDGSWARGASHESVIRRAVPGACLVRAGVRKGQRGAHSSIAMSPPPGGAAWRRVDRRASHAGPRERPLRAGFLEGRKHPDCRDGAPLRGGHRSGDLARDFTRRALLPSEHVSFGATQGARLIAEEGNLSTFARLVRARDRGVPSLPVDRLTPRTSSSSRPPSAQPTVAARTPPRTRRSRRAMTFGARPPCSLALHGAGVDGAA